MSEHAGDDGIVERFDLTARRVGRGVEVAVHRPQHAELDDGTGHQRRRAGQSEGASPLPTVEVLLHGAHVSPPAGAEPHLGQLTSGVPLAVSLATGLLARGVALDDLLNDLRPNPDAAELIRQLAKRYLRHVSTIKGLSDDLPLLYGFALLPDHVDDYSILAALWDEPEKHVHSLLRQLADRHDFVHSRHLAHPQSVMHRLVRDTLRRSLFDEDKRTLTREANERAIAYINRRLTASSLVTLEHQLSVNEQDDHVHAWQSYALALLWHTFWVDAADGVALTRHLYPPAALLAPTFAEHLAAVIRSQLISPRLRARQMLEAIADADGYYLDTVSLTEVLNDLTRIPVAERPYVRDIPLHLYQELLTIVHSDRLGGPPGYWVESSPTSTRSYTNVSPTNAGSPGGPSSSSRRRR